jgi:RNA polymerase sigma factor (sigma-70 family)
MQIRITFKNIEAVSHPTIEQRLRGLLEERLQPTLDKHFPSAAIRLFAIVEKSRHHQHLYRVALRLHLPPRKIVVAREDDYDLEAAERGAVAELERQVRRHLSRIRHEDAWKRKARRAELHRLKGALAAAPLPTRRGFLETVRPLLPRLENVVRRELAYLRATGDLAPDYPTVSDVIDETLVRAQRAAAGDRDPFRALLKHMIDVLAEEVARYRSSEEAASLEGLPAADQLAETGEDWRLEYWQPDEVLRIEDLVPAQEESGDPEAALERDELRRFLLQALRQLPMRWRRAVTLTQMESLPVEDVAELLGTDPETINTWLDHADAYLRARLEEAGLEPPPEQSPVLAPLGASVPTRESEFLPALDEAVASGDED